MDLTEQHLVPVPSVVGLLRAAVLTEAKRGVLADVLTDYCESRELALTTVVIEQANDDPRKTVTRIIDAHPGLYGIVLPSIAHLGAAAVARARRRQLEANGTRLLIVRAAGRVTRSRASPDELVL
ncbi:hypothetical protein ACIA8O_36940 [Kitasatospora sp. NPDC051853]|uniref:hypothetical protein n=1 Tax=Kitasatospora sp. NPDC051853 TaxID=3364058 RepID=UPI003789ABCF